MRVTHLPTGISAQAYEDRVQGGFCFLSKLELSQLVLRFVRLFGGGAGGGGILQAQGPSTYVHATVYVYVLV